MAIAVGNQRQKLAVLNLILAALTVFMVLSYAFLANRTTSRKYQIREIKIQLSNLLEENERLLSQKSDSSNIGSLLFFSQRLGLVAQKNIEYIFDRNSLALERPPVGQAIP